MRNPVASISTGAVAQVCARGWPLLLLLVVAIPVYANSFRHFPVIDRKHSVLADADSPNFKVLVEEFSLRRQFGDPYEAENRSRGDNTQKHKIHHILYAMVAHPLWTAARAVERLAGGTGERAAYTVNAIVTGLNIVLLCLLLGRWGSKGVGSAVYLLLYAGSLSTWIYASVPESWPFSATLVLAFFLFLLHGGSTPWRLAVGIGVAMLNNMTLIGLLAPVWLRELDRQRSIAKLARTVAGTTLLAVLTWAACLTLLGLFDPTLRPDRLIHYTLWFKQFVEADLPIWAPYVWKSALSNLFINSIASNQADPFVPQEALLYTLRQSLLGTVTVAAVVGLLGTAAFRAVMGLGRRARAEGWRAALADDPSAVLLLYCGVQAMVTVVMYYGAGFLYSPTVVPLLVLLAARQINLARRMERAAVLVTAGLVLLNNAGQVRTFRHALATTPEWELRQVNSEPGVARKLRFDVEVWDSHVSRPGPGDGTTPREIPHVVPRPGRQDSSAGD